MEFSGTFVQNPFLGFRLTSRLLIGSFVHSWIMDLWIDAGHYIHHGCYFYLLLDIQMAHTLGMEKRRKQPDFLIGTGHRV
jgi:hypothetical protein